MAEYGTTFPVTIPSLSEDANIVIAFEDYHDDIQTYLGALSSSINTKQNIITGAASTITTSNLTFSRAVISDSGGKVAASITTAAELTFLSGVTSPVQTQLDSKVSQVNGAVTSADTTLSVVRNIKLSTEEPTGGLDGDVWLQYIDEV